MKITDVKMHVFNSKVADNSISLVDPCNDSSRTWVIEFSLVRVLTSEDIEGDYIVWSELPAARPNALAETLRIFKPYLLNKDPLDREEIWQKLSSLWYGQKGPALAAIDIALWDIAGKVAKLPIYKLLGAYREKVRAYASGPPPNGDVEASANLAINLKNRGYKAMKLHPLTLEACKIVRDAVGNEIVLMHDAIFSYDRSKALKIGKALEKLDFYWYEAPLPAYDINGYVELTNKLDIPITVELLNNYSEYIQRGAIDILRTLSDFTGGITEMKKAASLCEMFGLKWEPHSFGGIFCQMANLHVILSVMNCDFFEIPINQNGDEGFLDVGSKDKIRIDKEGYVHAFNSNRHGLGVQIDWEQVKEGFEVKL